MRLVQRAGAGPDGKPVRRVLLTSEDAEPEIEEIDDWPDPPHRGRRG